MSSNRIKLDYLHRFRHFLAATGYPFSINRDNVRLIDSPDVAYCFGDEGITVRRPALPSRRIKYTRVNFDRLLSLAIH